MIEWAYPNYATDKYTLTADIHGITATVANGRTGKYGYSLIADKTLIAVPDMWIDEDDAMKAAEIRALIESVRLNPPPGVCDCDTCADIHKTAVYQTLEALILKARALA